MKFFVCLRIWIKVKFLVTCCMVVLALHILPCLHSVRTVQLYSSHPITSVGLFLSFCEPKVEDYIIFQAWFLWVSCSIVWISPWQAPQGFFRHIYQYFVPAEQVVVNDDGRVIELHRVKSEPFISAVKYLTLYSGGKLSAIFFINKCLIQAYIREDHWVDIKWRSFPKQ